MASTDSNPETIPSQSAENDSKSKIGNAFKGQMNQLGKFVVNTKAKLGGTKSKNEGPETTESPSRPESTKFGLSKIVEASKEVQGKFQVFAEKTTTKISNLTKRDKEDHNEAEDSCAADHNTPKSHDEANGNSHKQTNAHHHHDAAYESQTEEVKMTALCRRPSEFLEMETEPESHMHSSFRFTHSHNKAWTFNGQTTHDETEHFNAADTVNNTSKFQSFNYAAKTWIQTKVLKKDKDKDTEQVNEIEEMQLPPPLPLDDDNCV